MHISTELIKLTSIICKLPVHISTMVQRFRFVCYADVDNIATRGIVLQAPAALFSKLTFNETDYTYYIECIVVSSCSISTRVATALCKLPVLMHRYRFERFASALNR